ncbi:MAG: TetR/AcrR family transcriptional regulator [Parvibaculaceae bacterium]
MGTVHTLSTQEKILEVSIDLFAESGMSGVTMRQIAHAAEVTLPTIYHYFDNKEMLYRAVETKLYSAHAASLLSAMQVVGSASFRLRQFMAVLLEVLAHNPPYLRILQRGLLDRDPDNHKFLVENSLQNVVDELKALLDEVSPGLGSGIAPLYIFGCILGHLALQPVTSLLQRHPFSSLERACQSEALIETIMITLDSMAENSSTFVAQGS